MPTPIVPRDLTQQAPHSPRQRISGFVIAARAVDKCVATLAGKAGEYHFDCPLDNMLFSFKGITGEQFKAAVQTAKNYEDVGAWLLLNGIAKTPAEIKAWSDATEAASMMKNPETNSTFDWLEGDDRSTFSRKNGVTTTPTHKPELTSKT